MSLARLVAGIPFQNPILLAAGTAGFGRELAGVVRLDRLGGLVTKAVSLAPRAGNPAPRVAEIPGAMLNSVGLANPGVDHVAADELPWLAEHFPGLPVLVISMHDESLYAERVLLAGARGYIMKQEGGKKLVEAIRQVLSGRIYVSEKMSARILEIFSGRRSENAGSSVERLSDREFEVFQLISEGKGTREIAGHLHLSVKTVEVHRANIKEKLKVNTATDLIRYAVRWSEAQVGS